MLFNLFKKDNNTYEPTLDKWFSVWGTGPEADDDRVFESDLPEEDQTETLKMLKTMAESCVEDFKQDYNINLDFTAKSLKEIDKIITTDYRKELESQSNPEDFSNKFLVTICEIGAYIGEIFIKEVGGKWIPVSPYWDSPIIDEHGGENYVFHWAIKRFCSDEIEDGSLYKKFEFMKEGIKSGKFKEMELDVIHEGNKENKIFAYDEEDEE